MYFMYNYIIYYHIALYGMFLYKLDNILPYCTVWHVSMKGQYTTTHYCMACFYANLATTTECVLLIKDSSLFCIAPEPSSHLASHSESQPTEVDRCRSLEEYKFLHSGKVGHRKLKEGLEQILSYTVEPLLKNTSEMRTPP